MTMRIILLTIVKNSKRSEVKQVRRFFVLHPVNAVWTVLLPLGLTVEVLHRWCFLF